MESKEATQKGRQGENFVFNYLQEKGCNPQMVHDGYDIKAIIDGIEHRIEVKTTKNENPTIPDLNYTEFEGTLETIPSTGKMKASHIYIVTNWGTKKKRSIYSLDTRYIEEHVQSDKKNWLKIKYRITGQRLNKLSKEKSLKIY